MYGEGHGGIFASRAAGKVGRVANCPVEAAGRQKLTQLAYVGMQHGYVPALAVEGDGFLHKPAGGLLYFDGGEAGAGLAVYQYGQNARARPQVETAVPTSGICKVSQQHRVAAVCEARLVHYYGQAVELKIFDDFHVYMVA